MVGLVDLFGPLGRLVHRTGDVVREMVGEIAGELLIGGLCVAASVGVVALSVWGWSHSRVGTAGVWVAVAVFLAYGVRVLWLSDRADRKPLYRGRIAAAAATTAGVVALWLTYVVQFAPSALP